MGKLGKGRGGLAPEARTKVGFKTERGKVHTGKGAIIGQFLVDGEQVAGEVAEDLADLVSAAERDASDLINRDRVPRQYQKAIKKYFSSVQRNLKRTKEKDAGQKPATDEDDGDTTDAPAEDEQDNQSG